MDTDKPFIVHTDASYYAIWVVLEKFVLVALYSRKLTKSQINWKNMETETYAIVACLHKFAGWIGFQPVVVRKTVAY